MFVTSAVETVGALRNTHPGKERVARAMIMNI
jgi:hypothetical protein